MAPSFLNFKDLRRRSRASFRTERSADASSDASHGTTPTSGSLTPPSIGQQSDPALDLQVKEPQQSPTAAAAAITRPPPPGNSNSAANRYSVSGMAGLGYPAQGGRGPSLPVSQFSPRIVNVPDNSWAYQKVLLVCGTVGEPPQQSLEGSVTISRLDDGFPPIQWPVCDSHFKALVYLTPGANRLRFDFASPKLANSGSSNPIHASYLTVHMVPPTNAPPLQLAILLAKDSPATFDAVPARVEREGNGLDTATRKFRMAAYLWQAFTAEQMWRGRLGRRTFRFEEEWTTGTSNTRDREYGSMRSEARVHIIRSDKTVAELRRLSSDSGPATPSAEGRLYDIAVEEAKEYFQPLPGQKQYVSMLVLDYNWDVGSTTGLEHVISDDSGDLQLAILGSHCLQNYPTSFEEVVPAFTDCTPSDTNLLGNIFKDAGSSWEAATVGIGAHLHQSGHLFGLPHREGGVMARDYVTLNRSFLVREAYSTRTRSKGGPVFLDDECTWHRLDCLRFRSHPCFRLPNDPPLNPDDSVHAWPVEGGNVMVTGATGIAYLELYGEGDGVCHNWIEYSSENGGVQRQVLLVEQELRNRLPEDKQKGQLRISVRSVGGGTLVIDDFKRLSSSKESSLKLPGGIAGVPVLGKTAYRGKRLGRSQTENSQPHEVMFSSALQQERVLYRIIFYCSHALHALEFVYDDDSRQLFGKRGSNDAGYGFDMDIRRGEYITGFVVRAGVWIDAIQVLTSLGRRSPMFGNLHGGSVHTLIPPRGYNVCGVTGTCGDKVDGFSAIITR